MRSNIVLLIAVMLISAVAADAQQNVCPCVPTTYVWLANACDSWNCAASALVMANGDPNVMALPTSSMSFKWVVLRRVVSGSAIASPDTPFQVEQFSNMSDGSARYGSINPSSAPMLITVQSGDVLVVSLRQQDSSPPAPAGR